MEIPKYTIGQYTKLKEAISNGVRSVNYGDKSVTYMSIEEMMRVLAMMEAELFPERISRKRRFAVVDSGYFPNRG